MIAVDTNILVYAHRREAPFHARAREAVRELAEGAAAWAIPWPCVHEFLAHVTHPRIYRTPTPMEVALRQMEQWTLSPHASLLAEDPEHWSALKEVLERSRVLGPRVHDARVAALCLRHGVRELWTADRDFSRFHPLQVVNPLTRP